MISTELLGVILPFVGTVLLAGLYYMMFKQQKRQTDLHSLTHTPQLTIEEYTASTSPSGLGNSPSSWISLKNNGEVPFVASISMSFGESDQIDNDSPLLDPNSSFDEVPEEYKFDKDDWHRDHIFLNPDSNKKWNLEMFNIEWRCRHEEVSPNDIWCFLRVDAELESTLDSVETREIHQLFRLTLGDDSSLSTLAFEEPVDRYLETDGSTSP